jgi:signal transduction histidine kinase
MRDRRRGLAEKYAATLQLYLSGPAEPALASAHELGRQALTDGLGVLEMVTAHSGALAAELKKSPANEERARILDAAEKVFVETLSPFEMAHRAFWDANAALQRLNEVLEGQAKRIASALHDDAAQLLASVHLALADLAIRLPPETAQEIRAARSLLDQVEERLRHLAHELRPSILDDLGLIPALEFLADSASKRWGLSVTVRASIESKLPTTVETSLYRIAQEALTNVGRHAWANRAEVSLHRTTDQVVCSIRDDGVGIDPTALAPEKSSRGLGLREIQERVAGLGGVLRLGSNNPHGGDLTVEIPLERRSP